MQTYADIVMAAASDPQPSDTFAGISPTDVPAFIAAQVLGAVLAHFAALMLWQSAAD
jgi:hypothetical protein